MMEVFIMGFMYNKGCDLIQMYEGLTIGVAYLYIGR